MIGSYGPNDQPYEKKFQTEQGRHHLNALFNIHQRQVECWHVELTMSRASLQMMIPRHTWNGSGCLRSPRPGMLMSNLF